MSDLDVRQLGLYVVRPTLAALATAAPGIDGPVAEALLLGTAAQESGFRKLHQDGGPALGLWQMEPSTEVDLWRWLREGTGRLRGVVTSFVSDRPASTTWAPEDSDLSWNLRYACAMARLLYWRAPEPLVPLPDPGALSTTVIEYLAAYWKRHYNTPAGAGKPAEFIANYRALVQPHWPPPEAA